MLLAIDACLLRATRQNSEQDAKSERHEFVHPAMLAERGWQRFEKRKS
jgi:hypothetical protein